MAGGGLLKRSEEIGHRITGSCGDRVGRVRSDDRALSRQQHGLPRRWHCRRRHGSCLCLTPNPHPPPILHPTYI